MKTSQSGKEYSPSRSAVNQQGTGGAAFPAVAQLYKKSAIVPIGTAYQTDNNEYALQDLEDNDTVYALNGATPPRFCAKGATTGYASNTKTADAYTPSIKFFHDCLHTAEEIMKQSKLRKGKVQSKSVSTNQDFGVSEVSNWNVASGIGATESGYNASVNVGESYAIVSEDPEDLGGIECQFHAAAVVAKDGTDNITMEIFGNPDEKKRDATAKFNLYSEKPKSKRNFQAIWEDTFEDGITFAIGPK